MGDLMSAAKLSALINAELEKRDVLESMSKMAVNRAPDEDRFAREALVIRDAAQRAEAPQPTVWGRGRYAIVRLVPNADQYYIYDIQTGVTKKSMTNFLDAEKHIQVLKKADAQRDGLAAMPVEPVAPENYGGW